MRIGPVINTTTCGDEHVTRKLAQRLENFEDSTQKTYYVLKIGTHCIYFVLTLGRTLHFSQIFENLRRKK